jgi:glyoxylase-like metal-dependent hydrolase (beta-lactamase superfamily II)
MKVFFHLNIEGFSNCYVVTNPEIHEALIIDPGKITGEILRQIEDEQYNLVAVLITHNHNSHLRGLKLLQRIYTPKIYAADYEVAGSETVVLKGDGILKIAGLNIGYLALPGHTSDSMAYKIGRILFTGDALTAGMIGETNSSYAKRTLMSHVQTKILSQHDDMIIMPGHGPPTCVGAEKKINLAFGCPLLKSDTEPTEK